MTETEPQREPPKETDRIGIRTCTWKYHAAFIEDVRRINVDNQTWSALKAMMAAAADGTARDVNWEYPCRTTNGIVGELKHDEWTEVRFPDADGNIVEHETIAYYRIYYNEPAACPNELWAMGIGVKSHNEHFVGTNQQDDVEIAALRASQCHETGVGLFEFPL